MFKIQIKSTFSDSRLWVTTVYLCLFHLCSFTIMFYYCKRSVFSSAVSPHIFYLALSSFPSLPLSISLLIINTKCFIFVPPPPAPSAAVCVGVCVCEEVVMLVNECRVVVLSWSGTAPGLYLRRETLKYVSRMCMNQTKHSAIQETRGGLSASEPKLLYTHERNDMHTSHV